MTKYHTEYKAKFIEEEFYRCRTCGEETEDYHALYHPTEDSGGFCPHCKSDDVDLYQLHTVFANTYARSAGEAIETVLDNGEMLSILGRVILEKENTDGSE